MFRCNNEMRFDGPCQDAGEDFGFQEESEAVALLNCKSTSYTYCSEFGVPCDCSPGITASGPVPHRLHLLQCGHAVHLKQTTRGHFDPNVLNSTQKSVLPAVVVDGKAGSIWWTTCSWSAVLLDQPCCLPYTSDVGPVKLSLAGSAWWWRRGIRTGTREKAVVRPVSLPSSQTETWGKLPGSSARLCARFLALVSWCPGCVGGPCLWPSVPVLCVGLVPSCAPGLVALSGFVLRVCFKKRRRPRAPTQRLGFPTMVVGTTTRGPIF